MNDKLKELGKVARNPGWLCMVWFGMTAGTSLLEAPVKFSAPTLTRPVAIDVGRVVFGFPSMMFDRATERFQ